MIKGPGWTLNIPWNAHTHPHTHTHTRARAPTWSSIHPRPPVPRLRLRVDADAPLILHAGNADPRSAPEAPLSSRSAAVRSAAERWPTCCWSESFVAPSTSKPQFGLFLGVSMTHWVVRRSNGIGSVLWFSIGKVCVAR